MSPRTSYGQVLGNQIGENMLQLIGGRLRIGVSLVEPGQLWL